LLLYATGFFLLYALRKRKTAMTASNAFFSILAALLLGAMSPGPSFVIVVRNAIGLSRRDGLATALGMGMGGVLFACVALVGLYQVLAAVTWLYIGLKIAGGLYLLYRAAAGAIAVLGLRLIWKAPEGGL